MINEGCTVEGTIDHSVLSYNVQVGENSVIKDSVIMPNVQIGRNVTIHKAIIASDLCIPDGAHIGSDAPDAAITLIGDENTVRPLTVIK